MIGYLADNREYENGCYGSAIKIVNVVSVIMMADGQKLNDTYVVDLTDHITIHSKSVHGIRDAWAIFGDITKTNLIHSYQYGEEHDWIGYTLPFAILTEGEGIAVSLMKETD